MTRKAALVFALMGILVPLTEVGSTPDARFQVKSSGGSAERGNTMRYGLSGKLITKPGQRDAVVALLLRDVEELKAVGCDLYVVSVSKDHPDAVFVTEVWTSPEAHRASLALPSVKQAIAEAKPLLTGEFDMVELSVAGGLGVPKGTSN